MKVRKLLGVVGLLVLLPIARLPLAQDMKPMEDHPEAHDFGPNGPDRLTRVSERSNDEGRTWQPRFREEYQRASP